MIPHTGIISLAIFILFSGASSFEDNVPVYMWNIDTDAAVNPLHSLDSKELVGKVSLSLDRKLVALFMQDELSVEDFKSEDLVSLKNLAEMDNDGTFYAPSVTKTNKLPEVLEAAGYRVVHVKSHKDLPKSQVLEKTVLVVDLPATQLGDSRSENLQLNGNAVAEVYEVLKSQQPDIVGIFTAKRNSQLQREESRRRITRSASLHAARNNETSTYKDKFINITITTTDSKLFLFWENAPMLKIKDEANNKWGNFSLNADPDTTDTVLVEKDRTGVLVLKYKNLNGNDGSKLNTATISMRFSAKQGYWYINETTLLFDVTIDNKPNAETKGLVLKTTEIFTPLGFSWHCTPKAKLATYGFTFNGTSGVVYTNKVIFETNGFQLQPFKIQKDKFGDWYDCQGFFTEGIWAAIILGLIIAMMLAWAVSMVADIRTPDRYDDPKGKTITVTATD